MATDPRLTANFAQLARGSENEPFRKWIERERNLWRDTLETTRDETLFGIAQGRAQMLSDLQKLFASALLMDK